tara:strand:- start:727 stop:939 length:213 start_codon:yes stop_codon:yes gene_type:complete
MEGSANLNLNVHEIGILLSALQLLDGRDERLIAKEYGSAPTLYNKLYSVWETLDQSETKLENEPIIEPSY